MGRLAIRATTSAGSGLPTTALSLAHLVAVPMYRVMRWTPADADNPGSDRLVLSEGHPVPIIYAACTDLGVAFGPDGKRRAMTERDLMTSVRSGRRSTVQLGTWVSPISGRRTSPRSRSSRPLRCRRRALSHMRPWASARRSPSIRRESGDTKAGVETQFAPVDSFEGGHSWIYFRFFNRRTEGSNGRVVAERTGGFEYQKLKPEILVCIVAWLLGAPMHFLSGVEGPQRRTHRGDRGGNLGLRS